MTILVVGGTGTLGTQVVGRLAARGLRVRVLSRDAERCRNLEAANVEILLGDLRDSRTIERAISGASVVINASQAAFRASGGSNPRSVDGDASDNLIAAARSEGVDHFILLSIFDVGPSHPLEVWRLKYRAEQKLKASGLEWTVIRASAFMEWGVGLVGAPLLHTGKTQIYGRGDNPINFVSAHDVAGFVELAVIDPDLRSQLVTVTGPENLTFREVLHTFQALTGSQGAVSHVPLPIMRVMAQVMRPVKPGLAREIQAGVFLDTADRTADGSATRARYSSIPTTTLADMIKRDYLPLTSHRERAPVAGSNRANEAKSLRT